MPRIVQVIFSLLIAGVVIGAPIAYKSWRDERYRNFRVVRTGVLYRSGQLELDGLKRFIHDHGIKTVVTLRDARAAGDRAPDFDEEEYCLREGLKYVRIAPRPWHGNDLDDAVPADQNIALFRAIMADPTNQPVLIHCFAGIHRTGAFVAAYRMDFESWSNERAIQEMVEHGYSILDDHQDVQGYLRRYQPRRVAERAQPMPIVRPVSFPKAK